MKPSLFLSLILPLAACKTSGESRDTVTQLPAETDSETETESETDSETETDTDTGPGKPGPEQVVRFIALGDGGEGNDDQYQVSLAIESTCAKVGCDFVLYMGDNFYNSGVDGVKDDQFQTKFELPYQNLSLPFYVVLGNHDYGSTSAEWWKVDAQIEYTQHSSKWNMPAKYYRFDAAHASFFGLDTNSMMWGITGDQEDWFQAAINRSDSTWNIAYGHHPYISNGRHGNAGEYEGIPNIPVVSGESVQDFVEDHICGKVDVYLSGHDHNRQWLEPNCGTEFIVSGAAAKLTDLEGRGTATFWEDDTAEGFIWIELADRTMTGVFYDKNGVENYRRRLTK